MTDMEDWLQRTAGTPPVFAEAEIPIDVLKQLRRRDLTINVPGGIVVVRSPDDDPDAVLAAVFWSIIEKLTQIYKPALVERDSAVRLYIGRTEPGAETRIRQTSQTRWRKEIVPGAAARIERGVIAASEQLHVGEATIPVETPERLLLSLPVSFLRDDGLADLSIWLKSLVLVRPAVIEAYRDNPRPVVLKRIEDIARDVGNIQLADLLAEVIGSEQSVRIGRDRTGVGRTLIIPTAITDLTTTREPWLDRLTVMIRESAVQLAQVFPPASQSSEPLPALLENAQRRKSYDAYHSSSIEGYRLQIDEVFRLLQPGAADATAIDDIVSKTAVIGYGKAFDALIKRFETADSTVELSSNLSLDLYTDLFTPSVEAGLIDRRDLRRFRQGPVFIRNTLYVPPNAEKVPSMIDLVFDEVNRVPESDGLLRAALVHLWFVWVHPFPDGNGRVSRFLMNAALLNARQQWLTIRVQQRNSYFETLRRAQLDEKYDEFARFILQSVREASE